MDANRAICLDFRAIGLFLPSFSNERVLVLLGHEWSIELYYYVGDSEKRCVGIETIYSEPLKELLLIAEIELGLY